MARKRVHPLIDLSGLRDAWLTNAELSLPIHPSPRSAGLSVFLHSEDDASAFLDAASAPPSVAAFEKTVRQELPLAPRRWFKLAFEGPRLVAIAHYFQIDPRALYPITTMRRFFRGTDTAFPAVLESALAPELDTHGRVWGLVARHALDGSAMHAKLSLAVPPARVASVVGRVFESKAAEEIARVAHLGSPESTETFVTFTPGNASSLQVDVSAPIPERLPCKWNGLGVDWPANRPLSYAKWRADDPTWTAYVPLAAFQAQARCASATGC